MTWAVRQGTEPKRWEMCKILKIRGLRVPEKSEKEERIKLSKKQLQKFS